MEGLTTGNDAPLEVRVGGITGRGVFATTKIPKGSWLCEYKTGRMFPKAEGGSGGEGLHPVGILRREMRRYGTMEE